MKKQFIENVCCKERVIELAKTIKNLWYEPYKDIKGDEKGISFGSDEGYIIYNYITDKEPEINEILKEIQ